MFCRDYIGMLYLFPCSLLRTSKVLESLQAARLQDTNSDQGCIQHAVSILGKVLTQAKIV